MPVLRLALPLKKLGTTSKVALVVGLVIMPFIIISLLRGGRGYEHNPAVHKAPRLEMKKFLTNSPETQSDLRMRFAKRRSHLQEQCKVLKRYYDTQNSENAVKEHLTINRKHNLVYCAIEKIGCTFWKRVFQILSGFKNVTDPFQIQAIRAYQGYQTAKGLPFDQIHYILKHSKSFIFVREPYERLLSGYVDKLFAPNAAYWGFIGTYIAENFRPNDTETANKCGNDITFKEFIQYFIHSQQNNIRRDAHFVPNFEHCRPCELDYEYVGKLETFEDDTLFLLKELELDSEVKFTDFQGESDRDAIRDAADYVFSMRHAITKCMSMHEALFRAYRKLQIRGIISKHIEYPFVRDSQRDISSEEYKQELLAAHAQSGPASSRKDNRKEAFLEAFSTIPQELLDSLKDELSIDANLFGYEEMPKLVQDAKHYTPTFQYFDLKM